MTNGGGRMANKLKVVVLVVIILAALGLIMKQMKSNPQISATYEKTLVDVSANKVFIANLKTAEKPVFPMESPFSTGKNAYPAIYCEKDKTVFALDSKPLPEGTDPMKVDPELMLPRCPICGAPVIDEPVLPQGQKSMDVPGPVQIIKVPREK